MINLQINYTRIWRRRKNLLSGDYQPGIYHLINEESASWHEVAREIFKLKASILLTPMPFYDYVIRSSPKSRTLNTKFSTLRLWISA